jgi:serine/threonine protein kinase
MPEAIASRDGTTGNIVPQEDKKRAFLHGKERFLEEAELLIRMNHIVGVVRVWEIFEENRTAYYVMEFLEGETLKQLTRRYNGKLPYNLAVVLVTKASTTLDNIHRQAGIFHRDISPENIMVLNDGSIKIIDFGSAKFMSISENQQFSVVLKPGFAPPEQYASNMSQGSFTDVYAMAGTFYYLVSGKMIPAAPDRLMGAEIVPLDSFVSECPKSVAIAVDNALKMDAKYRTQTMLEFAKALSPVQTTIQTQIQASTQLTEEKPQPKTSDIWIEVKKGACAGRKFVLTPDKDTVLGRSSKKSDLVINGHMELSGAHIRIMYRSVKKDFIVYDISTNGTFYNGVRLEKNKKYRIMPGEQLSLGSDNCIITVGMG